MSNTIEPAGSPQRPLLSAARALLHLVVVGVVAASAYVLAASSLNMADRGGWLGALGWLAFALVVTAGILLASRCCCFLRRSQTT